LKELKTRVDALVVTLHSLADQVTAEWKGKRTGERMMLMLIDDVVVDWMYFDVDRCCLMLMFMILMIDD
jgi:hypothetical protein